MDFIFITKLLVSKDYDSILVVCNRFSKILHFVVTTEKIMVEGLCQDCGQWTLFYFHLFIFMLFFFSFSFNFLFLEQLGLGVISHTVTSVTT